MTLLKTSHLKSCDFWKNLQKQVTLRIVTFGNLFFRNQSLVIDYHQGVIDYTSIDVTLHFKFWKSKCLETLVIDYTSLKWFENVLSLVVTLEIWNLMF